MQFDDLTRKDLYDLIQNSHYLREFLSKELSERHLHQAMSYVMQMIFAASLAVNHLQDTVDHLREEPHHHD